MSENTSPTTGKQQIARAAGLVMALLNGRGISDAERDRIQAMINESQRKEQE